MTVTANIRSSPTGGVLQPFTVEVASANSVVLTLTAEQVDSLPATAWWSLVVTSSLGSTTLAQGDVSVRAMTP